jgi:hypothetical protein
MTKLFLLPGGLICDAIGLTEDGESRQILRMFLNTLILGAVGVAIVLAIAVAAPSTALAGPMNLADPVLVSSQPSTTWHDRTTTWQSGQFQKYHRLHQMVHAGRH